VSRLAIIIPVKNDARRLANCLKSLAACRMAGPGPDVIVVDNGSTDESPSVARAAGARVLVLPDLRVSQLRNAAAAQTDASLLAFVDADHEVAPTWIAAAHDAMAAADVGAAGAAYSAPDDGTWVQKLYGVLRGRTEGRRDTRWLGSGNMIVRRAAFEQVQGFDATLEACEDVDFCQRLRAAGWRIVADEGLRSVHFGDPPTLAALFRAERWRGRDNLRVSLRGPLSARELPSLLTPMVTIAALVAMGANVLLSALGIWPLWPALAIALVAIALAGLKAVRMAVRAGNASPVLFVRALAVAVTYDLARGLALVTLAPHHRQ